MSKEDIREHIKSEKSGTRSEEELVEVSHAMWDQGIDQSHEGLKRTELEEELGLDLKFRLKTTLHHLVDCGVVEEVEPSGVDTLVIAEWKPYEEGIVNGAVGEAAAEGIEALIEHIHDTDGTEGDESTAVADGGVETVRHVVADRFDLVPDAVESFLRKGDTVDKLNDAVEAVEEADGLETREDYGKIVFINRPYRYRLTEWVVSVYES